MDPIASLQKQSTYRVVFLDYLRIFAFISVFIGHKFFSELTVFVDNPRIHDIFKIVLKVFLPFVEAGGAGVVVFFLVSGYIIISILENETPLPFLIKRVFRIYPLYVFAVILHYFLLKRAGQAPNFLCLVQQLSLLGDIWEAPYSLGGVEWTLRVEIVFYLVMALLKRLGLLNQHLKKLPLFIFVLLLVSQGLSPIPKHLFKSYLTTYFPFLWLGVMVFLPEKKNLSRGLFLTSLILIFVQFNYNLATYQPDWNYHSFAFYGVGLFLLMWLFRNHLKPNKVALFFSELTFGIYLFHNWAFDQMMNLLIARGIYPPLAKGLTLFPFLFFCYFMGAFLEKPAIKLGKRLTKRICGGRPITEHGLSTHTAFVGENGGASP